MLVYDVTDHTGEITRHLAVNKESAIQAHLVHFGLFYLEKDPEVSDGKPLSEFDGMRNSICWDPYCCEVATIDYSKSKGNKDDH